MPFLLKVYVKNIYCKPLFYNNFKQYNIKILNHYLIHLTLIYCKSTIYFNTKKQKIYCNPGMK